MNTPKIDGHRHILFSEAIAVASKLDPVRSVNIYPADIQAESEEINRKKGVEWNRKMHDFDENIAGRHGYGRLATDPNHVFLLGRITCGR
jgi:hypothetical protein